MHFGPFRGRFGAKRGLKNSKKRWEVVRVRVFVLFAAARFRKSFWEACWGHFGFQTDPKMDQFRAFGVLFFMLFLYFESTVRRLLQFFTIKVPRIHHQQHFCAKAFPKDDSSMRRVSRRPKDQQLFCAKGFPKAQNDSQKEPRLGFFLNIVTTLLCEGFLRR